MNARELRDHKTEEKWLIGAVNFTPLKKNTLPGQFKRLGRPRTQASKVISVSKHHSVLFVWRDGEIFTDRHFYGYFVQNLPNGSYRTLLEFHWHPSHKGFHCVTPCRSEVDHSGRMLRACHELQLNTNPSLDPVADSDRIILIEIFCRICGINISSIPPNIQPELVPWN